MKRKNAAKWSLTVLAAAITAFSLTGMTASAEHSDKYSDETVNPIVTEITEVTEITDCTSYMDCEHANTSEWFGNESYHYKICYDCYEEVFKDEHSGGTANCIAKAACEVCKAKYGDTDPDNHIIYDEWFFDETYHFHKCRGCNEELDHEEHFGGTATCNLQARCEVCDSKYGDVLDHIWSGEWVRSDDTHWQRCTREECYNIGFEAPHEFGDPEVIEEATLTDSGILMYECTTCGYQKFETIPAFFSILSQPQSVTTPEGTSAVFSITVNGTGHTYQWQWSKDGGVTWANTSCKTDTYTIKSVRESYDGYMYRCVVKNAEGMTLTSDPVTLTVGYSITITKQPETVTVVEGNPAVFSVSATGTELSYLWEYSDDGGRTWKKTSCKSPEYKLNAARSIYAYFKYRCVITDPFGNEAVTDEATLVVEMADFVTITKQPENVTVEEGSSAEFTVAAEGALLRYEWKCSKDGGVTWIKTANRSATYKIADVKKAYDGYMYKCMVTDVYYCNVTTEPVTLTVIDAAPVVITGQPEDVTAEEGSSAVFSVTAEGVSLKYQWQCSKDGGTTWANAGSKSEEYTIAQAKAAYNGYMYRCVVTDGYGNTAVTEAAALTVAASEAVTITSQPADVTAIAGSAADFSVTAEGVSLKYQWQCSKDGGTTWANAASKTSEYSIVFVKENYNNYMYRCIVTDVYGNTAVSEAAVLTVTEATVSISIIAQPEDAEAEAGSSVSFSVTAEGTGLKYQWQCSKDGGITWANASSRSAVYTIGAVAVKHSGYMYRCIVTDADGNTVTTDYAVLTVIAGDSDEGAQLVLVELDDADINEVDLDEVKLNEVDIFGIFELV